MDGDLFFINKMWNLQIYTASIYVPLSFKVLFSLHWLVVLFLYMFGCFLNDSVFVSLTYSLTIPISLPSAHYSLRGGVL